MTIEEIDDLIRYHQSALDQYVRIISPSAQYLEKQTIRALEELKKMTGVSKGRETEC